MNPWICFLLIGISGAVGGIVNALMTDNGFMLPRIRNTVLCPGFMTNLIIGAAAALASWAFYGSGAGIDLGSMPGERAVISFKFSALAGAFLVGVAGAKWITGEADKKLLKESIKVATRSGQTVTDCDQLIRGSAMQVLDRVEQVANTTSKQ
jgi:membrane associated rhomboid family serine protease